MSQGQLICLAYSGGLDTSAIVPWLKEQYPGSRVLCFTSNVGQGDQELVGLEEKAIKSGAIGCVVDDVRERFVTEIVFPTLRAGAIYARTYLLGTSMARPIQAAGQVRAALEAGATALAHGCTGKGNDQVRFELTYMALAPQLKIIAPWREWKFRGREDLIGYLKEKKIPVQVNPAKPWSRDRNLWHISHEGGILEDPGTAPPRDLFMLTRDPADAPDAPDEITLEFEEGVPVALDSVPLGPVALIERLNEVAGVHGVGRADVVEDRVVGMKSRGVYETPGGTVLRAAHRELEQIVLDRRTLHLKDSLAPRYADLVYEGRWWTPERYAMDALIDVTQRHVTGAVRVRLFKGNLTVLSRKSPFSLYSEALATFSADEVYNQADAGGFIRLFGLPVRMTAQQARKADAPVEAD
jgi:argininosuccinate synthase